MGDMGSVYSYNGNYGQDNGYYGTQTRLSIPMDNGQMNGGYEPTPEHMRFPSNGSYNQPMTTYSNPEADHPQMGTYNERANSTSQPSMSPGQHDTTPFANATPTATTDEPTFPMERVVVNIA